MNCVLSIGTVLDSGIRRYRIVKVLGQGGFGITYKAVGQVKVGNIMMTVPFAIKEHFIQQLNMREGTMVLTPNASNADEVNNSLGAFLAEAERLNKLSLEHPGIVKVNEHFRANGTAYYVMEFVEGENLRHYVKHHSDGCLPESEAVNIIRQVGNGLSYLHSHGVTHLDVKPDNILLREDGQPVLIDFGLAKHYDKKGLATSTIKVLGTSDGYSPLEQYQGIDHFSPEADVYALAATLLFMLTGKDPQKAAAVRASSIQSELVGRASSVVTSAIVHAMKLLPEERTPSIARFLSELDESHPEEPIPAKPGNDVKIIATTPIKPAKTHLKSAYGILSIAVVAVVLAFLFLRTGGHDKAAQAVDQQGAGEVEVSSAVGQFVSGTDNGHEWVDLGLSVCWATMNVGASSPSDYGDYYAWGETTTKSDYSWSTYKYRKGDYDKLTKYCTESGYGTVDNRKELDSDDDVAHVKWGGNWRMPTYEELKELKEKCDWKWTTQDDHAGYKVTGPNGNSIFLPAAGYRDDSSRYSAGSGGGYWSRTLYSDYPYDAWYLSFYSSGIGTNGNYRYIGQSVRPVRFSE